MIDTDRKILTEEVLGECWHEFHEFCPNTCSKCKRGNNWSILDNRTFITPQDSHDVCKALVEKGKWESFYKYWLAKFTASESLEYGAILHAIFVKWLLIESPERTCQLAVDFWKEGRK